MFESGFSREAREQLIAIARKDAANGGFFEWDTKEGAGRGSGDFTGSAGSLARALIEGYYGIRMTRSAIEISPVSAWTRPGFMSMFRPPAEVSPTITGWMIRTGSSASRSDPIKNRDR